MAPLQPSLPCFQILYFIHLLSRLALVTNFSSFSCIFSFSSLEGCKLWFLRPRGEKLWRIGSQAQTCNHPTTFHPHVPFEFYILVVYELCRFGDHSFVLCAYFHSSKLSISHYLKLVYIWLASGDAMLRASPVVLSIWSHIIKLDEKRSTYAGLAHEIGFGSQHNCRVCYTAGERHSNFGVCAPAEKSVINRIWLLLSVFLIGPS